MNAHCVPSPAIVVQTKGPRARFQNSEAARERTNDNASLRVSRRELLEPTADQHRPEGQQQHRHEEGGTLRGG